MKRDFRFLILGNFLVGELSGCAHFAVPSCYEEEKTFKPLKILWNLPRTKSLGGGVWQNQWLAKPKEQVKTQEIFITKVQILTQNTHALSPEQCSIL